ncbi:MAG: cupin domain-containing protein [Desulfosarcinaceae bacterium]|nr:cupin domain-containing protein [Desulfosarcinaceae bacterium]
MGKRLITAADIRQAAQEGQRHLSVSAEVCIITPAARDEAATLGVALDDGAESGSRPTTARDAPVIAKTLIADVSKRLKARLPAGSLPADLDGIVREVVTAKLQPQSADRSSPSPAAGADDGERGGETRQGVRLIDGQRLIETNGNPLPVDEKMLVASAIGDGAEDRLAGGYMVWERAAFERQVEAPEIAVVLAGELELAVDGSLLTAKAGDMIYFPKGVSVTYRTATRVKLACINCI